MDDLAFTYIVTLTPLAISRSIRVAKSFLSYLMEYSKNARVMHGTRNGRCSPPKWLGCARHVYNHHTEHLASQKAFAITAGLVTY